MNRRAQGASRWLLALLLCISAARPALGAAAEAQAKAHFKQGAAYYGEGAYERALAEYQAAYALLPLPDLLFNIGQAQRMRGARREAIEAYRRYTTQKPDGAASELARRYIAALTHDLDEESRPSLPLDPLNNDDDPKRAAPVVVLSPPAPATPPSRRPTYKRWWVWTIVGAGLVGVGVGVGLSLGLPGQGFHATLHPELTEMALVRF